MAFPPTYIGTNQLIQDIIDEINRLNGGSGTPFTSGSVLFATTGGNIAQDNTNFFWDDTNNRLGIGTNSPDLELDIQSASTAYTAIELTNTNGSTRRWSIASNSNSTTYGPAKGFFIRDISLGATRFTIDINGQIGINSLAPSRRLTIDDGTNTYLGFNVSGAEKAIIGYQAGIIPNRFIIYDAPLAIYSLIVSAANGYLGIYNNPNPSYAIELQNIGDTRGQARANAWVTYSSKARKKNINRLSDALNKVKKLRGVSYLHEEQKDEDRKQIGFIAEEIEEIIPELVMYNPEDKENTLGLDYGRFTALLVEAVKELTKRVEDLENARKN